jgi:hypothetical protein
MKTLILKPKKEGVHTIAGLLFDSRTKQELLVMAKEYGAICEALKYATAYNIAEKITKSKDLTITIKHQ